MKIAIAVLSAALIAAVIAVIWSRSRENEITSFWDVVRNPSALADFHAHERHVEEVAAAAAGSEDQIGRLVDSFVFEDGVERRILLKLGDKTYPRALELLRDPSMKEKLVVFSGDEEFLREAPICRLADIFDLDAPPTLEAAELLAPFFESESYEIRQSVALIIGSVGSSDSLSILERALNDEKEVVRSHALMGIERAISGGRISQPVNAQIFEMVARMWPGDTNDFVCDSIPLVLLGLDRERAIEWLLRPDLFTAKFEPAWRILEAFEEKSVSIPRSRLLALMDEASTEPTDPRILGGTLSLLGRHRMEEDLSTLERWSGDSNEYASGGAIKGLYAYHRFHEIIRDPREVIETQGWDRLTVAEKHICAIEGLDAQVNNGGFVQYYFNSTGDRWRDALNGLAAIGATKRHEAMSATIAKFGKVGPSPDRDRRMSELSRIEHKQEDPFSEQDKVWYDAKSEHLEPLMFRYNLANMEGRKKTEKDGATQAPEDRKLE